MVTLNPYDIDEIGALLARYVRRPGRPLPIDEDTRAAVKLLALRFATNIDDGWPALIAETLAVYAGTAPATDVKPWGVFDADDQLDRPAPADPTWMRGQPSTSRDAAKAAKLRSDSVKAHLLEMLAARPEGLTHADATQWLHARGVEQTTNRVSTRLKELCVMGYAYRSDETRQTSETRGRANMGHVFKVTPAGVEKAAELRKQANAAAVRW